jgi:hypothetical protein
MARAIVQGSASSLMVSIFGCVSVGVGIGVGVKQPRNKPLQVMPIHGPGPIYGCRGICRFDLPVAYRR